MELRSTRLALGGIAAMLAAPACLAQYTFVPVADDSGPLRFISPAEINFFGEVAYYAIGDTITDTGIYLYSDGTTTPIATTPNFTFDSSVTLNHTPAINDHAHVAFAGARNPGATSGIFFYNGSSVVDVELDMDPWRYFFTSTVHQPDINNRDVIVAVARFNFPGPGVDDVLVESIPGGSSVNILDTNDALFASIEPELEINDASQVMALVEGNVGDSDFGLYRRGTAGGTFSVLLDSSATWPLLLAPDMNADGDVVISASNFDTDRRALLLLEGSGSVTEFITSDGPFSVLLSPNISDSGEVVFLGIPDASGFTFGIYTGPDPILDLVIRESGTLFGDLATDISLGRPKAVNERGQIVFEYKLGSGTEGLAIANPPGFCDSRANIAAPYTHVGFFDFVRFLDEALDNTPRTDLDRDGDTDADDLLDLIAEITAGCP